MYEPVENPSNNIIILPKKKVKLRVKLFNKYLKLNRLNYRYYIPIAVILGFFIIFCLVKLNEKNNEINDLETFINNNAPKNIFDKEVEKEQKEVEKEKKEDDKDKKEEDKDKKDDDKDKKEEDTEHKEEDKEHKEEEKDKKEEDKEHKEEENESDEINEKEEEESQINPLDFIPLKFHPEKIKNDNDPNENARCNQLDPINMFTKRIQDTPTVLCEKGISKHICYKNTNSIYASKNGLICIMEDIVLDPRKWNSDGYTYVGPVDSKDKGCPILSKGFFNMKCDNKKELTGYGGSYSRYMNGWNYEYKEKESLEELAPGKVIFFLSRNQDSPNLYHGGSEFMNAVSMLYLLDIKPENVQVMFLESIEINDDPFYDLYKYLISGGTEPIYAKNLKKKYHINSGLHVPINWDSPCFIVSEVPNCKNPTYSYKFLNNLVDKYLGLKEFEDSFISDNDIIYYPKSVIEYHKSHNKFTKYLTFQWRRVWPRGRTGQGRILANGPQLAEKLSTLLPKNILIRLIDTGGYSISEQISIMRKTDYFVGMHGAGLTLAIFAPKKTVFHEVLPRSNMNGLRFMSATSGHKTYSDIISSSINRNDGNENVSFNVDNFCNKVISHMKENKLID